MTLPKSTEALATTILDLSTPARFAGSGMVRKPLLKLPPVFTAGGKHGDPKKNLVAMLHTIADYESGRAQNLSALPAIYNNHGGLPAMEPSSMRRVHNWSQQVAFALRAASIEQEMRAQSDKDTGVKAVYEKLYGLSSPYRKLAFVAYSSDSPYQIRPLRYATKEAILRWIGQEWDQRVKNKTGMEYGAQPSREEWESFGLKGQNKSIASSINSELMRLTLAAKKEDMLGNYQKADLIDHQIQAFHSVLEKWENNQVSGENNAIQK